MVLDPEKCESPNALAHNLFEESDVTSDNESAVELITNAFNRSRVNKYSAITATTTEIFAKRKTALLNGFFEISVSNWILSLDGGTATFTHNTTTPLTGSGDGELDVTVLGSPVAITSDQVFTIKAGETWKFAGKFVADAARTLTLKLFDSAGLELESEDFSLTAVTSFKSASFTNETKEDLFGVTLAFQITTVGTINIDDLRFNSVRDINTLLVDSAGLVQTLRGASLSVQFSATEDFASPTTFIAAFIQTDDEIIRIHKFTGSSSLFWKFFITAPVSIPSFSQLWLGKSFFFKIRSKTPFAPDEVETNWKESKSESGVLTRYKNFDKLNIEFKLPFIATDGENPQYAGFKQWHEDTREWIDPYFILVEPTSDSRNISFGFTKDKRFRPRRKPGFRDLKFTFTEQAD